MKNMELRIYTLLKVMIISKIRCTRFSDLEWGASNLRLHSVAPKAAREGRALSGC